MRKNVKLTNKKVEKKPKKESYFFFVKDQGEGAARVVIIILKILELIMTTIFGLCLGIFAPLFLWSGLDNGEVSSDPSTLFWFVSSILYIIGLFAVMLGHSKTAAVIHGTASVGTLLTYNSYLKMFKDIPYSNGPTGLYMPCLFITIMTIVIMLLANLPTWVEKRIQKENEIAPSILGDDVPPKK